MSNLVVEQGESVQKGGSLTRVDVAQVVCQALVYERAMKMMHEADPDGGFGFGNVTLSARNGNEPSIIDKTYWKRLFTKLEED